jgi:two-component system, NtrC family, C4-dicarboxylate transport sensor histidine kinase DctB
LDQFRAVANVSDVYLLDRHGTTLAASNWHMDNTFIGHNYAFRSYYQDAIEGGRGRFFGLGTQSLERGYYFSAPVWLDDTTPDARPDGVMVIKVLLDAVEESWAEQDAELLVTDADNIIFMASRPELRMAALHPLSEAERETLLATRRYADDRSLLLIDVYEQRPDGSRLVRFSHGPLGEESYLSLARHMEAYDWDMHILKPLGSVYQAQWLAAALAGGLMAWWCWPAASAGSAWRLRRERELFAERERHTLAKARDELERNVELRTRDLTETNRLLSDEIEERRRAEENLRRTQDELVQAAKLAVLGQLAAGINHELNQPLAAIRAYAENARTFLERQRLEAADANLAQVVELTERMADISAQLRQFSRKSDSSLTAVSVQACFDYALRLYQNRCAIVEVVRHWEQRGMGECRPGTTRAGARQPDRQRPAGDGRNPSPRLTLSIEAQAGQVLIGVTDTAPAYPRPTCPVSSSPSSPPSRPAAGWGWGCRSRLASSGTLVATSKPTTYLAPVPASPLPCPRHSVPRCPLSAQEQRSHA